MTTTLRPAGPEEPAAGGGRTRRWQICVNGRPVGGLRTTAQPRGDQWWGEIAELEVVEGHRRGRATVGALAAEEVLRGWGCTRVDVTVPAESTGGLRLAEALGYTERMRNLAKRLARFPELRTDVTVRPIGEADYAPWLEQAKAGYRHDLTASGLTPPRRGPSATPTTASCCRRDPPPRAWHCGSCWTAGGPGSAASGWRCARTCCRTGARWPG